MFLLLKRISSFDDADDVEVASVAVLEVVADDDDGKVFWMIVGRGTIVISPNGSKKNRYTEK